MKEKINLTIEKSVKERAKQIARSRGISVSEMVEELLKSIEDDNNWMPEEGSVVSKMAGSIPIPGHLDYNEILTNILLEKEGYEKDID
jgi:hypothetical protein